MTWLPIGPSQSHSPSAYSGSPAHSDYSLPVVAPQPQHATATSPVFADVNMWKGFDASFGAAQSMDGSYGLHEAAAGAVPHAELVRAFEHDGGMGFGMGWDFPQSHNMDLQGLFEPAFCRNGNGHGGGDVHSPVTAPDFQAMSFGYEYNDMTRE